MQKVSLACVLVVASACATPGQVRQLQTQVEVLDRDHARADSARAAEIARIQATQRRDLDSINVLVGMLNESIQRLSRETAGNFDKLTQQLYNVANLANTTRSQVAGLRSQIETAVTTTPTAPATSADTGNHSSVIPQPDALLAQARNMMDISAYDAARRTLNLLIATYPQSQLVPDAVYWLGNSFDPSQPDSARAYYTKVWKNYPQSVRAPTALFKLGELELRAQNISLARAYWQQIVSQYKQSDEFQSAQDRLRENP